MHETLEVASSALPASLKSGCAQARSKHADSCEATPCSPFEKQAPEALRPAPSAPQTAAPAHRCTEHALLIMMPSHASWVCVVTPATGGSPPETQVQLAPSDTVTRLLQSYDVHCNSCMQRRMPCLGPLQLASSTAAQQRCGGQAAMLFARFRKVKRPFQSCDCMCVRCTSVGLTRAGQH